MAEYVNVRNEFGEEKRVPKASAPFFVNQGFKVLTPKGNVSEAQTTAAKTTEKER